MFVCFLLKPQLVLLLHSCQGNTLLHVEPSPLPSTFSFFFPFVVVIVVCLFDSNATTGTVYTYMPRYHPPLSHTKNFFCVCCCCCAVLLCLDFVCLFVLFLLLSFNQDRNLQTELICGVKQTTTTPELSHSMRLSDPRPPKSVAYPAQCNQREISFQTLSPLIIRAARYGRCYLPF